MIKTVLLLLSLTAASLAGEIETQEVEYNAGAVTAKGFLATPKGEGPHPGVLVVHEWWGANEYPRARAKKLAELGYVALAIDMYGNGQIARHPKDAGTFSTQVKNNQASMIERFQAGMDFLKAQQATDGNQIAAVGYCFGGNVVLQMAYNGLPGLDGVASFHGSLGLRKPAQPAKKKSETKVLVCNGAADPFVTAPQIETFKKTMKEADIAFTFENYDGATHGFTNQGADEYGKKFGLPLAYHPEADKASWKELESFLAELFKSEE